MRCKWDSLLRILPEKICWEVDAIGREDMEELRLRINAPPELVKKGGSCFLNHRITREDIMLCVRLATNHSPWRIESLPRGYITLEGGHRIGLCGLSLRGSECNSVLRDIQSLCIRVARDFPGIGNGVDNRGSILILGPPGWGKTTLLRDLARIRARRECVAVVDERGELFPEGFLRGQRMDVLSGVRKSQGIAQVLRTMGPACIALDEITEEEDCVALCKAVGCGVNLLATAHAGSLEDFLQRPVYQPLIQQKVFSQCLILNRNRDFTVEGRLL